jgi:hypothetical protein
MRAIIFHDNILHTNIIQKDSEYRPMDKPPKKLLEQVRDVIRLKHYSYKTEKSYINWIKRYILSIKNATHEKWVEKKLKNF